MFKRFIGQVESEIYNTRKILRLFILLAKSLELPFYTISEKNLQFAFFNANENGGKCGNDVTLIKRRGVT